MRPAAAIPRPIPKFSPNASAPADDAAEAELAFELLDPVAPAALVEVMVELEDEPAVELPVAEDVAPLEVAEQPATVGRVVMPLVAHSWSANWMVAAQWLALRMIDPAASQKASAD
jgi:hypothetical protein